MSGGDTSLTTVVANSGITAPPITFMNDTGMSCTKGFTMVNKECTPIPYLEESSKFVLTCPAEYTLNTNPDKSVVCVKNVASFTPHINMETFSQNSIGNTNGKCKTRY